jgi:glycerol uptake facilitator-like aquaporin
MILYIAAQIGGGALAGLLVRASWGGRDFKTGGCWLFTEVVPPREIFVVELVSATILLFLAFGVGLDPRQAKVIGPALGPFLVGLSVGTMSFASAFTRYGYGGAGLNPARCMGAFVGSRFPTWHWINWYVTYCDVLVCYEMLTCISGWQMVLLVLFMVFVTTSFHRGRRCGNKCYKEGSRALFSHNGSLLVNLFTTAYHAVIKLH